MNVYKIVYRCNDGCEHEELVCAANRIMAFEMFKDFGHEDVINVDCFRITDEMMIEG